MNNLGNWSPLYLNTNLISWFDASDTNTLYTTTGGTTKATSGQTVALWKDKSGHGYNATSTAPATLTGQSLVFNGTSNVYTTTLALSTFSTTATGSIFAVVKPVGTQLQYAGIAAFRNGGGNCTGLIVSSNTGQYGMDWLTNNLYSWVPGDTFTLNSIGVVGFVQNGSTQTLSFNGTTYSDSVASSAIGTTYTTIYLSIGNDPTFTRYWAGGIYEMVFVSNNLSTANRQKLEGYLAWKWGVQASLPVAHPYYHYAP